MIMARCKKIHTPEHLVQQMRDGEQAQKDEKSFVRTPGTGNKGGFDYKTGKPYKR